MFAIYNCTRSVTILPHIVGWCVHQGAVPAGGGLGQEEHLSGGSQPYAARLCHALHTFQTCGEQEKGS